MTGQKLARTIAVLCVAGCSPPPLSSSAPPPSARPAAPAPPPPAASADTEPKSTEDPDEAPVAVSMPKACPFALEARPLPFKVSGGPGYTGAGLRAMAGGSPMRIVYSADKNHQLAMADIDAAGASARVTSLVPIFPEALSPNGPSIAESGGVIGVAAQVYPATQNGEIGWSTKGPGGSFTPMTLLDPSPLLDGDPHIAPAPQGRFAIVWARGTYPFTSDIQFGLIEKGRLIAHRTLVPEASAEGMAFVATSSGYALVYTPTSAGPRARQGVFALVLGPDGQIQKQLTLLQGNVIWPVAAWDGEAVAVAFRWEPRRIGFARFGLDGTVLTAPLAIETSEDPVGNFRPTSIRSQSGLTWVSAAKHFTASVWQVSPTEAHVIAVGPDGRPTAPLVLPKSPGGSSCPVLSPAGAAMRAVYAEAQRNGSSTLKALDITCRTEAAPAVAAQAPGPCDPRLTPIDAQHFAPLKDNAAITGLDGDLVAARFAFTSPDRRAPDHRLELVRLTRQGAQRWASQVTPKGGYHPAVAVEGGEVAVVYTPNEDLVFTSFDAATGQGKVSRSLRSRQNRGSIAFCMAATGRGYLLAYSGDEGSFAVRLRRDGTEEGVEKVPAVWNGCGLTRTSAGFLLAFTFPGLRSETNYLHALPLDTTGKATGRQVTLDSMFSREPVLREVGAVVTVAWTGPLGRDIRSIDVRLDGQPVSAIRTVAESYGFMSHGLIPDGDRARLVFSTAKAYGERRLCAP